MTGQKFGRWTVIQEAEDNITTKPSHIKWVCQCECGERKSVMSYNLTKGLSRSCGCYNREVARDRGRNTKSNIHKHNEKRPKSDGRTKHPLGYIYVYIKPSHESHYDIGKRIYEHTLVMSNFLGRKLLPHENVHHKNGQRDDNRLENLELWSSYQPAGQKVIDKVKWAKEILALYGTIE